MSFRPGRAGAAARGVAAALLLAGALPLAGCGDDVARAFGFVRNSPDEFTVTTQAPLAMPPNEALPPPAPGTARPQDQAPQLGAEEALAPDVALRGAYGASSAGQSALLAEVSARAALPTRAGEIRGGSGGITGDLMFWQSRPSNIVVNPAEEGRRLRQDAANGQSPLAGPTPATETASN